MCERGSEIMQREARENSKSKRPQRIHERPEFETPEYEPDAFPPFTPQDAGPQAASGPTAQTVSTTFLGATLADCQAYPPDTMGAVGPQQFIVAVNGRIRTFNKFTGAADGAVNANTDTFFASVMTPPVNNNFTSDPRIRYDRLTRLWFIIMIDVPGQAGALPDRIMIAVSDGPVITGNSVWSFYQFQHDQPSGGGDTGKFADYPTLGVDANALYIGVNIFGSRGLRSSFDNTSLYVVRKSSLLSGGPIVVTAFRGLIPNGNNGGPYTPQGVDNFDPNATEGYVIGVNSKFYDRFELRRISNSGGTPTLSGNVTIMGVANGATIKVPHLGNTGGTAGNLDALDYRLMAACVRNGRLWTSANLAVDNTGAPGGTDTRVGVRWWEIQGIATGQTPSIVQAGTVFEASPANSTTNLHFFMGTVMVSGQGHAAMGFTTAGANAYANAATVGRLKNDASGTMRTPVNYTTSSSAYNPRDSNNNPIERWGDYSYTCVDPDDDMTMWTIQEWCSSPNYFGVQIAKLLAPPPATPLSCSPSSVTQGVANVSITLFGASDGDTGFFDPGAGFSNRIAAAISGAGVTVNSVTYNNPTNLTLNLSVAGAASAGARSITVTNPDGQVAASAGGILTIVSNGAIATNQPPTLSPIGQKTVTELQLLTFTNSASDPDGNALTFSLGAGAPTNSTIGASSGVFSWTPTEAQGPGTNSVSVIVTDNGSPSLSATQTFTVFVLETNAAPTLALIADRVVHAGSVIQFTNVAADNDLPANTLTFSLQAGAPSGASVNPASGVFVWPTTDADAGTTNGITVIVSDNGVPNLNASRTFAATVVPRPVIQSIAFSNSFVVLSWSAISGQIYQVQSKLTLELSDWSNVPPNVTATSTNASHATIPVSPLQQFYRVFVVP